MRRITDRSTSLYVGPRTGFREADPIVNWLAIANADVLNHRAGVRSSDGKVGSPTRFGRWVVKPAYPSEFACVTATGTPDCSVTNVATLQSFTSAPTTPPGCFARPWPTGRSHTTDAAK